MNRKLGMSLFALLAVFAFVFASQPAAAAGDAKAPISLEELFTPASASSTPALANGQDQLFAPQALGCTNQYCQSTVHCRQICDEYWVACVSQLGTKRCVYL